MAHTFTSRKPTKSDALAWKAEAEAEGFTVHSRNHGSDFVVELRKQFTPGDHAAYIEAESGAGYLLAEVPKVTYGTTWGTTSDGVGGHAGLVGGYVEIKTSGVSKRFGAALR